VGKLWVGLFALRGVYKLAANPGEAVLGDTDDQTDVLVSAATKCHKRVLECAQRLSMELWQWARRLILHSSLDLMLG
jgi:hypothetical protein